MTDHNPTASFPTLEEMQHWTHVIGKAQQMMIEHSLKIGGQDSTVQLPAFLGFGAGFGDGQSLAKAANDFWSDSLNLWQRFMTPTDASAAPQPAVKDRRFAAPGLIQ